MERLYYYMIGATLGSVLIIATIYYYERLHRRDPNYRKKLKLKKEYERRLNELDKASVSPADIVETRREEDVIILHELQIGEALMLRGNHEAATQHFANAISVCSNPEKFLKTLKGCLDPAVYNLLLNALVKGNINSYSSKMYLQDTFQSYPYVRC